MQGVLNGHSNIPPRLLKEQVTGDIMNAMKDKEGQSMAGSTKSIPCKFFKLGTCKLGDQCRFSHAMDSKSEEPTGRKSLTSSNGHINTAIPSSAGESFGINAVPASESTPSRTANGNLEEMATKIPERIRYCYSRRPFLHLIVLFATDTKVMRYAKDVQNSFLDNGIDVYLQGRTEPGGQYIKAENLAEIINSSKADHVVVLGDRNMKNKTVQGRKRGKLVEMQIEEMVNFIWSEWADKTDFEQNIDPDDINEEQLDHLVEKFCNLRHLSDRIEKVSQSIKDLREWKNPSGLIGKSAVMFGSDAVTQHSLSDEKMAAKLTQTQKSAIRLHQQLNQALHTAHFIPIENQKTMNNSGRGLAVSADYAAAELKPGISESLKEALISQIESAIADVEQLGNQLLEFGSPLWASYRQEFMKAKKAIAAGAASTASMPGSWSCSACTYVNKAENIVCEICQKSRETFVVDSEWSLTGQAGKKQRKQQREREKQELEQEEKKKVPIKATATTIAIPIAQKPKQETGKITKTGPDLWKSEVSPPSPIGFSSSPTSLTQTSVTATSSTTILSSTMGTQAQSQTQTRPIAIAQRPIGSQAFSDQGFSNQVERFNYDIHYPPLASPPGGLSESNQLPESMQNLKISPPNDTAPIGSQNFQKQIQPPISHPLKYQPPLHSAINQNSFITHPTQALMGDNATFRPGMQPSNQSNNQSMGTSSIENLLYPGLWLDNSSSNSNKPPVQNFSPFQSKSFTPLHSFSNFNDQQDQMYNWMTAFSPLGSSTLPQSSTATGMPTFSSFVGNNSGSSSFFSHEEESLTPSPPGTTTPVSNSFFGSLLDSNSSSMFFNTGDSDPMSKMSELEAFERERQRIKQQVKQKLRNRKPLRPCCYCEDESYLECNHCAKMGLFTYFCSPDHQSLMWKEHLEFHKNHAPQSSYFIPPQH